MEDELWMRKIKERLDDYSAPIPTGGWERLQQDLDARKAPVIPKQVPFIQRWSVAAAATVLLCVSMGTLWFLHTPVADEVRLQSGSAVAVAHEPTTTPIEENIESDDLQPKAINQRSAQPNAIRPLITQYTPNETSRIVSEETATFNTIAEVTKEQAEVSFTEKQPSKSNRKTEENTMVHRPSSRDKLHLPATARRSKRTGNWSMGVAVGNMGGLSNGFGKTKNNYPTSTSINRLDWVSTANGVITVPKGQELVFKDGMPYLQNSRRNIESIDHKQPISFGLSVRKNLQHGLSIESGLTYTFLSSDITFEGSSKEIHQKLHYIGIPMRVNWDFVNSGAFTLYVSGGGTVEKCIYGTIGNEQHTVKPLQFSVMAAVGAQYNIGSRVGLYIEPGISYYFDDNSSVETIRKENPCNFTLQGGIRLTY